MTLVEAVKSVFSQYATFSGRARRSEYWYFQLFTALLGAVLWLLMSVTVGTTSTSYDSTGSDAASGAVLLVAVVVVLALFTPGLAVTVRRLHDAGFNGWLVLLSLIPQIGGLVVTIMCILDSKPYTNEYGPNPKDPWGATPPPYSPQYAPAASADGHQQFGYPAQALPAPNPQFAPQQQFAPNPQFAAPGTPAPPAAPSASGYPPQVPPAPGDADPRFGITPVPPPPPMLNGMPIPKPDGQ